MDAAFMSPERHGCGIHGLRSGANGAGVTRVRFRPGQGAITVNKQPIEKYFTSATHRMLVTEPLRVTNTAESYDIDATIDGGGISGQAGAMRLGIARSLPTTRS